jgi:hypothetical protein
MKPAPRSIQEHLVTALRARCETTQDLGWRRLAPHAVADLWRFSLEHASASRVQLMTRYLQLGVCRVLWCLSAIPPGDLKTALRSEMLPDSWLVNYVHVSDSPCHALLELKAIEATARAQEPTVSDDLRVRVGLYLLALASRRVVEDQPGRVDRLAGLDLACLEPYCWSIGNADPPLG